MRLMPCPKALVMTAYHPCVGGIASSHICDTPMPLHVPESSTFWQSKENNLSMTVYRIDLLLSFMVFGALSEGYCSRPTHVP